MDKLVWLVSPSNFNVDVFIKKVSFLSACLNKDLVLAVDYNDRFTHRDYWSRLVGFIHHEHVQPSADKKQFVSYIKRSLEDSEIPFSLLDLGTDESWNQFEDLAKDNLLVLNTVKGAEQNISIQGIRKVAREVLIIGSTPWHKTLGIVAAIDPLHEHERPMKLDKVIVASANKLKVSCTGDLSLLHCCFVPPALTKHRKSILDIHREGLSGFARDIAFPIKNTTLIEGVPEEVIPHWFKKAAKDILVIGSVSRGTLAESWIGSTTYELLKCQPCDMYIVTA